MFSLGSTLLTFARRVMFVPSYLLELPSSVTHFKTRLQVFQVVITEQTRYGLGTVTLNRFANPLVYAHEAG
jgi:hypothetical protein